MANTTTSPNMGMPVPNVAIDPGTDYATNINQCMSVIDSHTHQPGSGKQINSNAIAINADLSFNNFNLVSLGYTGFAAQGSLIASGTAGVLYRYSGDLYFNDSSNNQIQITKNGAVNITASGAIQGLSAPASATFSSPSFVFQSGTNIAGNLDGRSLILRNSSASSKGLTLNPPSAMAADISMTLPAIPGVNNSFIQMDTTGAMTTATADGIAALMTATGANTILGDMTATAVSYTPTFTVNAGSATSVVKTATYFLIGKLCFVQADILWTQATSSMTVATITLPFTAATLAVNNQYGRMGINGGGTSLIIMGSVAATSVNLDIGNNVIAGATSSIPVGGANAHFSFFYFTV